MTIEQIREDFKAGRLTAQQALKNLAPYMRQKDKKAEAQTLVSEILGMPEEPKPMSADERERVSAHLRKGGE